jgi:hypothetical protein
VFAVVAGQACNSKHSPEHGLLHRPACREKGEWEAKYGDLLSEEIFGIIKVIRTERKCKIK